MPPQQLTLVRHAQGFHDLNVEGHRFHDPRLTTEGQQQCRDLAQKLRDVHTIDCVVASPLLRTMHTALLVFEELLRSTNLRIIALPELQETSDLPCDIGSPVEELRLEFKDKPVDLSLVPENWTDKVTGIFTPHSDHIAARCRKARHFLASLAAKHVAVVAHGAVLHYLTDDWYGATRGVGTGWYNCEARVYCFDTSTDSNISNAAISETDESRMKRTLTAYRFSGEQQLEMKKGAEASWADDGYIVISDATSQRPAISIRTADESKEFARMVPKPRLKLLPSQPRYNASASRLLIDQFTSITAMTDAPPKPFTEQLAFQELGENSWATVHPPQQMGNALPIAYGGYALAVACKAACLSVPEGYHIYSFMGNYLGPAITNRPLRATTRTVRQTRTFATRHVEVSQIQDNGKLRVCLFATADFQVKEKGSMFEYSRPPTKKYSHHTGLPSTLDVANALLAAGKVDKAVHAAFTKAFYVSSSLFNVLPCPEGIFAQNLSGVAKSLPHTQDDLPLTSRTTADWFRSATPLPTPIDNLAALTFYSDGALSFCPLSFSHLYLDDSAACSSLDFALRFFGEVDLNCWHLREITTSAGSGGRTFSECWIWDEEGRAMASMSQQSIMRVLPEKGKL